jgi:hypothetical protein
MPSGVSKPAAAASGAATMPYLPSVPTTASVAKTISEGADLPENDLTMIQEDIIDLREPDDGNDELLYGDTLDIDRYDMDFESADDQWVDIPLTEEDR